MERAQVLDLYFIDARSKLIDIAAFLDRVERADGGDDFRLIAFQKALSALAGQGPGGGRAKLVLMAFSDPTQEPLEHAGGKAAAGAWKQ